MELSFTQKKSIRKSFGKLKEGLSIPNLIEVQKNSYQEFLSSKALHKDAENRELSITSCQQDDYDFPRQSRQHDDFDRTQMGP